MTNPDAPSIVLTAEEVEAIADYVDYGPVRDKLQAFLDDPDVTDYLEKLEK